MSSLMRYLELYDEIMDRMPKEDRHLLEELDELVSVRDDGEELATVFEKEFE